MAKETYQYEAMTLVLILSSSHLPLEICGILNMYTNLRMRSWVCPNQWLEGLIPRPARVRGAELRPPFSVASKPRECPRRVGRHCPHQERAAQRWNEIHTSQSNRLWRVPNFSTVELRLLAHCFDRWNIQCQICVNLSRFSKLVVN